MPLPVYEIGEAHAIMLSNINRHLFEYTSYSMELLDIFSFVFKSSLNYSKISNFSFNRNFDNTDIHQKILLFIPRSCFIDPPNIVILEAGSAPNDDEGIFESCEIYKVYSTELCNTNGRRSCEVNIYTYLQIQELFAKKSKKDKPKSSKLNPIPISELIIATSIQSEIHIKKKLCRTVNDLEKSILDSLAMNFLNSTPTTIAINETLTQLSET
ncbi:13913_t:CDS:2 [Cetraspora pellucida]|uniref:13913_t:CDS:1 n=1 Tax=Cetraspora pellucida TaxID=1433469 RepID=A0ACA9MHR5_9GLOM|nr:13913_t:CDS:2 [Cetraspora pellucida]